MRHTLRHHEFDIDVIKIRARLVPDLPLPLLLTHRSMSILYS